MKNDFEKAFDKCQRSAFQEEYDENGRLTVYWRLEPVCYLSINLCAEYVGKDRATVAKRAKKAELYTYDGPKDAKLYKFDHLCEAVFRPE